MRIALVGLTYPFRGGISHYTTLLARALAARHEVLLVGLKRQYPGFLFPGSTQFDYSATQLKFDAAENLIDSLNPISWLSAARRIIRYAPDVLVVSWWQPFFGPALGAVAYLVKRGLPQTKIIFLCHNVRPHEASIADKVLSAVGWVAADGFIVHSEEDRSNLIKIKPEAHVKKSPHPSYAVFRTESTLSQAEARARLGLPADGRVILYFGYVRAYKGLRYLIEAIPQILAAMPVTLLIAGEFYDDKDELMQLITDLKIGDQVIVHDRYMPNEEVGLYFAAGDVVVLPYISATQSGVIQIAYGFGKGVITSRVGGLPEAVDEGQTGMLVNSRDSAGLAQAVLRFYQEDLGRTFPAHIETKLKEFSWDKMVQTIESLTEEI